MKKVSTKFLTLLLALVMCVSLLAGCGGGAAPQEQADNAEQGDEQAVPAESYKVGVVVYDNTDLQQQAINKYLTEYIGPAFNVEFIISDAIKDSNQEISFLENCTSKGVKGIMSFYTVTDPKVLFDKCKELGLYYITPARKATDADIAAAEGNLFFVGGVGPGSGDYDGTYEMTETFLKEGARSFVIATGGKDFGVKMFIDRYNGAMDAINTFKAENPGTEIKVEEFGGFPNDAWFASQAKMIASNPDAIIATFSGEFLWVQPLADAGKAGEIKLGTISSMNPVAAQAFAENKLHFLGAIYPQMVGPAFAQLYNVMLGYNDEFSKDGKAANIETTMIAIKSPEEMSKWMEVIGADIPPYSVGDLKKVIKVFNPEAAYDDLVSLAKANSYEDITERRAQD